MNKILVGILFTLAVSSHALAQENDSSLLRKENVIQQDKLMYIHSFDRHQDTCVYNSKKFNEIGMLIEERTDLRCMGYPTHEDVKLSYEDGKIVKVEVARDGLPFNTILNSFEEDGESPVFSKTLYHQTNDSSMIYNTYFFNKKGKLDSNYTKQVSQDGSTETLFSIARYNKNDDLVQLTTINERGIPTEQASYDVDDYGNVLSAAFQTYGEKANFMQTFYTYNEDNQLVSSYNTVNQKQEFFYFKNGLLKNVLSYNPKGELEVEYIYKYYYK